MVLNLANNNLDGDSTVAGLFEFLQTSKSLQDLDLSGNRLGDSGVMKLSEIFEESVSHLKRLNVSKSNVKSPGAG